MSTRARSSMRPGSVSSTVVGSMDANSGASSSIGVGTTARFKGLFKGRRESDASVGALTTQSEPTPSLFGSLRRGGTNQTIASGVPSTALPPSPAFVPSSPPTPLSPTFTPSTARDTMPQKATWRSSILSMSRFSMASAPSVILDGGTESSTGRDVDTDTATDFFASVVAKPGPDTVRVGADNESSRSSLLASNASVLDFNNEYGGSERAVSSLGFAEGGGFVASPPPPPPQRLQPMAGPWNMDSSPRARSPLAMVAGMVPGSVQNGAFRAVADNFCLEDSAFPGITAYEYLECKSGEVVVVLDVGDIPGLLWCENFQTRKSGFVPERKLDMLHPVSLTNRRGF
ncbi:hypothetical protein BC830DRAFT_1170459 [Chytriomyces sp. MP71]|nr:hypothetical protein BC830DRAFT_1170459 [Chytriomyces sp. MP71]